MPGACYERTGMSRARPAGRHPAAPPGMFQVARMAASYNAIRLQEGLQMPGTIFIKHLPRNSYGIIVPMY